MTFITNFFGTYGIKVFLAFVPFLIVVVYFMTSKSSSIKNQEEIKKRFNTLSGTIADKSVAKYLKKQEGKATFLTKINAQLNILGIENKFENLSLYSVALFFVGAVSVNLFIVFPLPHAVSMHVQYSPSLCLDPLCIPIDHLLADAADRDGYLLWIIHRVSSSKRLNAASINLPHTVAPPYFFIIFPKSAVASSQKPGSAGRP